MKGIYKNWTFHNLVSHPLSELVYWVFRPMGKDKAETVSGWVHDASLPEKKEDGRG